MPGSQYAGSCQVKVAGTPLAADVEPLLTAAWVDGSLHLPDQFVLRFRDPDRVVVAKAGVQIGALVEITVDVADSAPPAVLLKGEVTTLEVDLDAEGTATVVRGYAPSHRLRQGSRVATYLNVSYAEVVRKVIGRAGLKAGKIQPTSPVHPLVGQHGVDDWTFLQQLATEVGYRLNVEDGALNFAPPTAASGAPTPSTAANPLVLRPGDDLLSLRATVSSAGQVPSVEIRSWDHREKRAVVETTPAGSAGVLNGAKPAQLATKVGAVPQVATGGTHTVQSAAKTAAKALAERIGDSASELEGTVLGNPALRAGVAVALDGLGVPFDGKYTLTRVRHVFDPELGYTTAISVTGAADRSLLALSGAAPSIGHASDTMPGVAVGVVTNIGDPEGTGRVKVRFGWLSADYETDWAPTVHLGAGPTRGWFVLPEVNDQVLVGFEQGDLHRPFVLGGLYSTGEKPSAVPPVVDTGTGKVVRRTFLTRSGHTLDFTEKTGGPDGIKLATGDGKYVLELDRVGTKISVRSDGTVAIDGVRGITVTSTAGDITLTGQKILLDGKAAVEVKGPNVSVTADANLALKGAAATLQGQATAEVKGGAMTTISGAVVKIN